MITRPRILRKNSALRSLVAETRLHPSDFIAPVFIIEGSGIKEPIASLPDYFRYSLDKALKEIKELYSLGIRAVLLFAKCPEHLKDNEGKEALNPNGLMQQAIRGIKKSLPEMIVMTDVAMDPYSSYGHDGIVQNNEIVNDESVSVLSQMAVSHAKAGADVVAPSDMMDGRIEAIRLALEQAKFHTTAILSYSAKYASCFYGPFRDALDSAPGFGDKKTYQMNPANRMSALKEIELDIKEGADIVMVKPALSYLDIIREVKMISRQPVAAYHVSGEYAMIKAAAEKGWLNEEEAMFETTLSVKRAGADLIATYYAKELAKKINQNNAYDS